MHPTCKKRSIRPSLCPSPLFFALVSLHLAFFFCIFRFLLFVWFAHLRRSLVCRLCVLTRHRCVLTFAAVLGCPILATVRGKILLTSIRRGRVLVCNIYIASNWAENAPKKCFCWIPGNAICYFLSESFVVRRNKKAIFTLLLAGSKQTSKSTQESGNVHAFAA